MRLIVLTPGLQGVADRSAAELAEVAGLLQLAAGGQHEVLQLLRGAVGRPGRSVGAVGPVDAVEPLRAGPGHPELDGGQGDPEVTGDVAQRGPAADGGDHLTATFLGAVFEPREPPAIRF
jgi:hypothetical protein